MPLKKIGWILGIALGATVALLSPPEGLTPEGMRVLGIMCAVIVFFVFDVLPGHLITLLMCSSFVLCRVATFSEAFGGFSSGVWWLVVAALGIGVAIGKCGLLRRLSLLAMRLFPPTFGGMVFGLLSTGTLFAPMMPSISAKLGFLAPVSIEIGRIMGFRKRSMEMAGLFNAMLIGWGVNAPAFMSASVLGYLLIGTLPERAQADVTWMSWFVGMIPWTLVLLGGSYFLLTRIYRPVLPAAISRDAIDRQIAELGPMSREEKRTAALLVSTFALWITEGLHGIPSGISALFCLIAMAALGLFSVRDFDEKIPWGLLVYVGGTLNIGTIFSLHSIDLWLGNAAGASIGVLTARPWLYAATLAVAVYLLRFVIVSYTAAVVLITVVLAPIAAESGIHPWVTGIVVYCSAGVWVTLFQSSSLIVAWAAAGGEENLDFAQVRLGSIAYLAINVAGLVVSVPWWRLLGYI